MSEIKITPKDVVLPKLLSKFLRSRKLTTKFKQAYIKHHFRFKARGKNLTQFKEVVGDDERTWVSGAFEWYRTANGRMWSNLSAKWIEFYEQSKS